MVSHRPSKSLSRSLACLLIYLLPTIADAADWPTYRNGNSRQASTDETIDLADQPVWVYRAPAAPRMAWSSGEGRIIENHLIGNLTKYDNALHPVVAGDRIFFGSSVDHHLYCLDLASGRECWVFPTGGPIRLAPTVDNQRAYFGSDDGYAYCLSATDGKLIWKLRASSLDEWLLARGEMISRWPVRTSVLVDRGTAYFGAGIFPHEDVYLCAVDAVSGKVQWRQDHLSNLDAGRNDLSPQGYLLASDRTLFVPSGRSLPAALDRESGELLFKRTHAWRTTAGGVVGGVHALLADDQLYASGPHHWLAMNQTDGEVGFGWFAGRQIAVQGDHAFIATGQTLAKLNRQQYAVNSRRRHELEMVIYDSARKITSQPDQAVSLRKKIAQAQAEIKKIAMVGIQWQVATEDDACLIASGNQVFLGGQDRVSAFDQETGREVWKGTVEGEASGLVLANGHLLVSTNQGAIYCFADSGQVAATTSRDPAEPEVNPPVDQAWKSAQEILSMHGDRRGFCLVIGSEEGRLAQAIAQQSDMLVIGVEPDSAKVQRARERLRKAGLYGRRVVIHCGELDQLPYANYFANLIVSERFLTQELPPASNWSRHLKPLGGKIILGRPGDQGRAAAEFLAQTAIEGSVTAATVGDWHQVTRGGLPGAGSWTHLYGNPANTGVVSESRVKTSLGVLWYGDPGPGDMVNRHEGAVGPLATNGRLFVQGETNIQAYDAYNGLLLWKHDNPEALRTGVFQNQNPANLAANDDRLFHFIRDECFELDASNGEVVRVHRLPPALDQGTYEWGYVATHDGILFGAATKRKELELKQRRRGRVTEDATDALFAIALDSGRLLWQYQGQSISHHTIAIGIDRIYFVDSSITSEQRAALLAADKKDLQGLSEAEQRLAEERLKAGDVRRVVSLELRTGEVAWSKPVDVTDCSDIGAGGGKLSLLFQNNVLLLGGANANGHYWKQFVAGEFTRRRLVALSATDGQLLWAKDANYKGRPITIGDRVLAEPWSFDLYTGKQHTRPHPLTGQEVPWSLMRTGHHCGVLTGCDSGMLMFRSGDTAFYDLETDVGAQHFAGHRLGCWINAIPANGLVMIPEASAGCVCQFSIASTIVMEPRASRREWAIYSAVGLKTPVESMRINFGAPGDRKDASGNVWFSYPRRKAYQETSLDLSLDLQPEFQLGGRFTSVSDDSLGKIQTDAPWIYASWGEGLRRFILPLLAEDDPPAEYQLSLYFVNKPGSSADHKETSFDLKLQDQLVRENVTISSDPSSASPLVLQIPTIKVEKDLVVELVARNGTPLVCAVEVRRRRDVSGLEDSPH